MNSKTKIRLALMGVTLIVIWAGATAFNTVFRPDLEPQGKNT